jgi:hypothetical protein
MIAESRKCRGIVQRIRLMHIRTAWNYDAEPRVHPRHPQRQTQVRFRRIPSAHSASPGPEDEQGDEHSPNPRARPGASAPFAANSRAVRKNEDRSRILPRATEYCIDHGQADIVSAPALDTLRNVIRRPDDYSLLWLPKVVPIPNPVILKLCGRRTARRTTGSCRRP